jgi:cell division protein FtsW
VAEHAWGDPYAYLRAQALRAALGVGLAAVVWLLPLKVLRDASPAALLVCLGLLILSFTPFFRDPLDKTYRWIYISGTSIQPSEFARVGIVMFMAWSLSRAGELARGFRHGFLPHLLVLTVFGLLIVFERDLGGAVIAAAIIVAMCWLAGLRGAYFALFGALLAIAVYYFVIEYGYRMDRIRGWLDPYADPAGSGYVYLHSSYAYANGGIFGAGPGQSLEKLFFIPKIHNDYVFAVVGEELGLIGVILISGLFLGFAVRGFMIARAASSLYDFYLAAGCSMVITLPAFVNIAMTLSILPAKGLALPFFSYGGSNMLTSCVAAGLILNVARRCRRRGARAEEEGFLSPPASPAQERLLRQSS